MIETYLKDEYWEIVEDCLTEIHHLSLVDAVQKSRDLRRRLRSDPPDPLDDIIYHEEPFYVACDLARNPVEIEQHEEAYNQILSRHNW